MPHPAVPEGLTESVFRRGYGTYEVGLDRMGDEAYTQVLETVLDVEFVADSLLATPTVSRTGWKTTAFSESSSSMTCGPGSDSGWISRRG